MVPSSDMVVPWVPQCCLPAALPALTLPSRTEPGASTTVLVFLTLHGVRWRKLQQLLGEVVGPHQGYRHPLMSLGLAQ